MTAHPPSKKGKQFHSFTGNCWLFSISVLQALVGSPILGEFVLDFVFVVLVPERAQGGLILGVCGGRLENFFGAGLKGPVLMPNLHVNPPGDPFFF